MLLQEYQRTLLQCHLLLTMARNVVEKEKLGEAIYQAQKADTLGAVADPTLYREKGKALQQDIYLMQCVQRFVHDMTSMVSKATPKEEQPGEAPAQDEENKP